MTPLRVPYWNIHPIWLFYLMTATALLIFGIGLRYHWFVWKKAIFPKTRVFSFKKLIDTIIELGLAKRIFHGDISAGLMHLLIMWGCIVLFIGTIMIAADYWVSPFLFGRRYLQFSFVTDIAGAMVMLGVIWALVRRYIQRIPRLENRPSDLIIPIWLLVVAITGFMTEAVRTAAQHNPWTEWSFIGNAISLAWTTPESALKMYPVVWWTHAILSLGLIAFIPYSKLFHLLVAPISIYLKNDPPCVIPVEEKIPGATMITIRDVISLDACIRCGRCVDICPASKAGEPFAPRAFVVKTAFALSATIHPFNQVPILSQFVQTEPPSFDPQFIWRCATCRACVEVCPMYIQVPDVIRQQRATVVEAGTDMPERISQTLKKIHKYDNPWEATKKKRDQWAEGLMIPDISTITDQNGFCYFVGCTTSMETRAQNIARSFVKILNHTGTPFSTLGKKEPCCGDIARRVGEDGLFEMKMEDCMDIFKEFSVHRIVTSSPHCFTTFKNDYAAYALIKKPAETYTLEVHHYSQVLESLQRQNKLQFKSRLKRNVTYHDPCYLGRYNRIFDAPRNVIRSIPGIRLYEMEHHREHSLCCGGGGGRMWQDDLDKGTKISEIRIREAVDTGSDLVITTCPLCLIMLEDARKTSGLESRLQVMDLNELVVMALGI